MNDRFILNRELVKSWLDKECRKATYLCRVLKCSKSLAEKMVYQGQVPGTLRLDKLAEVMGVEIEALLLPRDDLAAS